MNFPKTFSLIAASTCIAVASGFPIGGTFAAEDEPGPSFEVGPINVRASMAAAVGAMRMQNAQFGQGSNSRFGEPAGGRTWFEGVAEPRLDFTWNGGDFGEVYGRISAVAAATRGQGEAVQPSTTSDRPEHVALDEYFVGWRRDWIDLSAGNQDFVVGDGFLIANGTLDAGGRAAALMGSRDAFERTAILRLEGDPVRAEFFHLQGGIDQVLLYGNDSPDTRLYGVNVEWFEPTEAGGPGREFDQKKWYIGATALKIYDADSAFSFAGSQGGAGVNANRDGLQVYALRFGGSFIPTLDDLSLYGEWGLQRNRAGKNGGSVRAEAWYLQPQYRFPDLPWTPSVTARYAHFSGDGNSDDTKDGSWDPLFSDAGPRGGGTWKQGMIFGNFVGSNSNLNSWHAAVEISPVADELTVGLGYYRLNYDKPAQAGAQAHHLMDEINLYATWTTPVAGLSVSPAVGAGWSGAGQRQALGLSDRDDRTIWLGQVVIGYQF